MNIGRHNYEEYFILYMDNELKPAERRMVESFVQLHPDLKDELDLLMQFKLEPDESVVFEAKDDLLKKVRVPAVNETNYNEWLLLYVDNELTASEKLLVDQFLVNHPHAQKEWSLLQQTSLQAENIVFENKSVLYKSTAKVRTIAANWRRIAVAAILLLSVGLTTAIIVNRNTGGDEIVKTNPAEKINVPGSNKPEEEKESVANNIQEDQKPVQQEIKKENDNLAENNRSTFAVENKKNELVIAQDSKDVALIKDEAPTNNLPRPLETHYMEPNETHTNVALTNTTSTDNIGIKPAVTIIPTTSFNPGEDGEQPEGKKTKLRGLFRKVARTFEKRANIADADDENKLLVAGLAFKLK